MAYCFTTLVASVGTEVNAKSKKFCNLALYVLQELVSSFMKPISALLCRILGIRMLPINCVG